MIFIKCLEGVIGMGYNPNIRKTFSLAREKEGKNQKDLRFSTPKILRMLALDRIDLENDGHWFFDKILLNTMIDVTRERSERYYWDYQAYCAYIYTLENGIMPPIDRDSGSRVIGNRNDVAAKYNAYATAYKHLTQIKINKSISSVIELGQAIKPYSNYF